MNRTLLLIVSLFLSVSAAFGADSRAGHAADLKSAIDSLDRLLQLSPAFDKAFELRIDSLKQRPMPPTARARALALKEVADNYRLYNIDSALHYYSLAEKSALEADSLTLRRIRWAHSSIMPVNGQIIDAISTYAAAVAQPGDSTYLAEYYKHGVDLYHYIIDFFPDREHKNKYAAIARAKNDTLLTLLPPGEPITLYHSAMRDFYNRDFTLGMANLQKMVEITDPTDNMYARATAMLSSIYMLDPERRQQALYYLALAAAGDIKAATHESTALQRLGLELYNDGDIDHSYRYVLQALNTALNHGSRLRVINTAEQLPHIAETFKGHDRRLVNWLVTLSIVLFVTVIALILLMIRNQRQHQHVLLMRERLRHNNTLKDAYIQKVLAMCSIYIERMEEFNRLVSRKIKAGQVQDLYQTIEGGKMLQEQSGQFFEVFDSSFFSIFPDFIDEVNRLLQPDRQLTLTDSGHMTPEIRILAFMRLGIDDSAKLAKFLRLSLNTIYTYRNKLKSRAFNRETFEQEVKNIGKIE